MTGRRRVLSSLLTVALLGARPNPLPPPEDIVENYLRVVGGRDRLKAIQTLRMTGTIGVGLGMEATLTTELKRPMSSRTELVFQGDTTVTAFNGVAGWRVLPFKGKRIPELIPLGDLKQIRLQSDLDGFLVNWKEDGTHLSLLGKEALGGLPVWRLRAISRDEDTTEVWIDVDSNLPVRVTTSVEDTDGRTPWELILGDYRDVDGFKYPFSMITRVPGSSQFQVWVIRKIEINPHVDDARFDPPAGTSGPPASPQRDSTSLRRED